MTFGQMATGSITSKAIIGDSPPAHLEFAKNQIHHNNRRNKRAKRAPEGNRGHSMSEYSEQWRSLKCIVRPAFPGGTPTLEKITQP